jgi:hypothetical protein
MLQPGKAASHPVHRRCFSPRPSMFLLSSPVNDASPTARQCFFFSSPAMLLLPQPVDAASSPPRQCCFSPRPSMMHLFQAMLLLLQPGNHSFQPARRCSSPPARHCYFSPSPVNDASPVASSPDRRCCFSSSPSMDLSRQCRFAPPRRCCCFWFSSETGLNQRLECKLQTRTRKRKPDIPSHDALSLHDPRLLLAILINTKCCGKMVVRVFRQHNPLSSPKETHHANATDQP